MTKRAAAAKRPARQAALQPGTAEPRPAAASARKRRPAKRSTGSQRNGTPARTFLQAHRGDDVGDEAGGQQLYGIRELAAELAVTPRAIRFYEQKGLLSPKRVGSTRVYGRRERARLSLIVRGKALGLTLQEIKQYLDLYGKHGEGRRQQLEIVVQRTGEMIAKLTEQQSQLQRTLDELKLIRRQSQLKLRNMAAAPAHSNACA